MKKRILKFALLGFSLAGSTLIIAQNVLYKDRHKEVEYNYAIIDSGTFDQLSETEKIKYELRYSETSIAFQINPDYQTELEIVYDSNGYSKDWLKLPKRMVYGNDGIQLYGITGEVMNTLAYDDQQLLDRANDRIDKEQKGYHPGLTFFPVGNPNFYSQLFANGIQYTDLGSGKFSITSDGVTTTYDKANLLITTERFDELGQKCKDYDGYTQMENGKGYLQVISKTERAVKSIHGPCLTEVKLNYYFDYHIEDNHQLMSKAINQIPETIFIYPNPNQGIFNIQVQLHPDNNIQQVRILNMTTGAIINLTNTGSNSIEVNMPNLEMGFYAVQVQTNNSIITRQFLKQ